jgi:hypothetical protein
MRPAGRPAGPPAIFGGAAGKASRGGRSCAGRADFGLHAAVLRVGIPCRLGPAPNPATTVPGEARSRPTSPWGGEDQRSNHRDRPGPGPVQCWVIWPAAQPCRTSAYKSANAHSATITAIWARRQNSRSASCETYDGSRCNGSFVTRPNTAAIFVDQVDERTRCIICCVISNCRMSWLTSIIVTPAPAAIRRRRLASNCSTWSRSQCVIAEPIAFARRSCVSSCAASMSGSPRRRIRRDGAGPSRMTCVICSRKSENVKSRHIVGGFRAR